MLGKTVVKQSDASEGFLNALGWPPEDLLTGEELVAVDEHAGDVAEEKDEDDADEDRSQVDLLLHRGSCPRVGQPDARFLHWGLLQWKYNSIRH